MDLIDILNKQKRLNMLSLFFWLTSTNGHRSVEALWFLLQLVRFELDYVYLLVIWSEWVTHCLLPQVDKDENLSFLVQMDCLKTNTANNNWESLIALKSPIQTKEICELNDRLNKWWNNGLKMPVSSTVQMVAKITEKFNYFR